MGFILQIPTILVIFFLFSLSKKLACTYRITGLWDLKDLAMDCYYNGLVAITVVVHSL